MPGTGKKAVKKRKKIPAPGELLRKEAVSEPTNTPCIMQVVDSLRGKPGDQEGCNTQVREVGVRSGKVLRRHLSRDLKEKGRCLACLGKATEAGMAEGVWARRGVEVPAEERNLGYVGPCEAVVQTLSSSMSEMRSPRDWGTLRRDGHDLSSRDHPACRVERTRRKQGSLGSDDELQ